MPTTGETDHEKFALSLADYFGAQGITLQIPLFKELPLPALDRLTLFLGNHYEACRRVYKPLKRRRALPYAFSLDLETAEPDELAAITQFCTLAKQAGLLLNWHYQSTRHQLTIIPLCTARNSDYIAGHWLERYIRLRLRQFAGLAAVYEIIPNAQVWLPSGQTHELDLLALVNGQVFWFEAKLQAHARDLTKYSRLSQIFGLDHRHSYVVTADTFALTCQQLSQLYPLSVVRLDGLDIALGPLVAPPQPTTRPG